MRQCELNYISQQYIWTGAIITNVTWTIMTSITILGYFFWWYLFNSFAHFLITHVRLSAHFSFKQLSSLFLKRWMWNWAFYFVLICIKFCLFFHWDGSSLKVNQTNLSFAVREHLPWCTQRLFTPNTLVLHRSVLTNSDLKWKPIKDWAVCSPCTSSSVPSCQNKIHTCIL